MIREVKTNEYLKGFESWPFVEKRLLIFIITQIMPAIGLLEIGAHKISKEIVFRWSDWGTKYLEGETMRVDLPIPRNTIRSQGDILLSPGTPFALRYQLSRFCDWISLRENQYKYQINLNGLITAQKSGMEVKHIQTVLLQLYGKAIPPTIITAINNYEKNGCVLIGEKISVLRLSDSQIIEKLMNSPAARCLGEKLNPTAVIIQKGKGKELENALLELGYFSDMHLDV